MIKGLVFSLDIVIGIFLLLIVLISSFYLFSVPEVYEERGYEQQKLIANDFLNSLAELKVSEAATQSKTIENLILDGNITEDEQELSVLNLILTFFARYKDENNTVKKEIAENITKEMANSVKILKNINFSLSVGNDFIVGNYTNTSDKIVVSSLIENTYSSEEPKYGYMARGYLSGIETERASYLYFGGFVGQGNLSFNLYIPENAENITSAYLEVSAGSNFSLFVNNNFSGNFFINSSAGNFSANIKSSVNVSNFRRGNNTIKIVFNTSNLTEMYLGGGFLRVNYNTTELFEEKESGKQRYNFLGIEGIINLYDGFYIPGNLTNINIYLHYYNNLSGGSIFLTIANATVFESNEVGEVNISLNNSNISSSIANNGLSYYNISKLTIPIRLGMKSITFTEQEVGNADVVLITDLSGSMNWRMNSSDTGIERSCDDPLLYDPSTKRISVAKCLDKDFVRIIMNLSGNRMGLVGFNSNAYKYTPTLNYTKEQLISEIDSYPDSPSGGTCICCAINKAYQLLQQYSNASRDKYIIVMSDGIPSECCGCAGWSCWWIWCWCNSCDQQGTGTSSQYSDCGGGASDCTGTACSGAIQNAIFSSCRVHADLNATVHSVGFGPVATCENANYTLHEIADCGNGSYYASQNASELQEIYRNIAQSIVSISYTTQKVSIEGNVSIGGNLLYNDSYIEFNYNETGIEFGYGEFSLTFEKNCTNGTCILDKKNETEILDAKITSYSGDYWTSLVVLTNSTSENLTIYNLSKYGNYERLGDPFIISIPVKYISNGTNNITLMVGLSEDNQTLGSNDSKLIYSLKVPGFVGYGSVFNTIEEAEEDARNRLKDKIFNLTGQNISILGINTGTSTITGVRTISNTSLVKLVYWRK